MDIYSKMINQNATEHKKVIIGRSVACLAMLIAVIIARPLLGNFPQAFQFIQEFTGFFTPGIVTIFLLGFFWKRATATSALVAAIASVVLSALFWKFMPGLPFIDRVGIVFIACVVLAVVITLISGAKEQSNAIHLDNIDFSTRTSFNVLSIGVVLILVALYSVWW